MVLFVTLLSGVTACGTFRDMSKSVAQLELGMSKKECIAILKNDYQVEFASMTPDGALEVLKFYSSTASDYILHFLNGELVEYHRYIPPPQPPAAPEHGHNHKRENNF